MSKIQITGAEYSMEAKSMWAGAMTPSKHAMKVLENDGDKVILKDYQLTYTERVQTIIVEFLINIADQHVKASLDRIELNYDSKSKVYRLTNYGSSFNIQRHEIMQEWEPFILMVYPHMGTETIKKANSITGGTNGCGGKLAVRSCAMGEITTYDVKTRRKYILQWRHKGKEWFKMQSQESILNARNFSRDSVPLDLIDKCMEGIVEPMSYTSIKFLPRYDDYHMNDMMIYDLWRAIVPQTIEIGLYTGRPVFINGELAKIQKMSGYISAYINAPILESIETLLDPDGLAGFEQWSIDRRAALYDGPKCHFPIRMTVVARADTSKMSVWANINGVVLRDVKPNAFFSHFIDQVISAINPAVEIRNYVKSMLSFFFIGAIPSPEWAGQTKIGFTVPDGFVDAYIVPPTVGKTIWNAVKDQVMERLNMVKIKQLEKMARDATAKMVLKTPYVHCDNAKLSVPWATRSRVTLYITEGTSATKMVQSGIKDWSTSGIYEIGGVPMNGRRACFEANGLRRPNEQLANDEIWNGFMHVTGLDYAKTYISDAEFQTLLYPRFIIMTDQDVDGLGKITSLILNFIALFWPELIRRRCFFRLQTDRIRVFDGKKLIKGFVNDADFEEWAISEGYYSMITQDIVSLVKKLGVDTITPEQIQARARKSSFSVRYYKGLGGNGAQLSELIFARESFLKNLVLFEYDELADKYFRDFFERDSGPRKEILMNVDAQQRPPKSPTKFVGIVTTCSEHLLGPMVEYSIEDLGRKLSGVYDGLNDVKLRALYTIMVGMRGEQPMLREAIAGMIVTMSKYHHSVEGLYELIAKLSQSYFGSRRWPFLIGLGEIGNKNNPTPAAARYTSHIKNNRAINALFPPADLPIYPFRTEDGERTVPQYFCPVIPPIFERVFIPSTGWQISSHAIRTDALIDATRKVITSDNPVDFALCDFPLDLHGWNGTIVGENITLGRIRFNSSDRTVCVTDLPIGMTGVEYEKYLMGLGIETIDGRDRYIEHPFIPNFGKESIKNQSSGHIGRGDEIAIIFTLKPEFLVDLLAKQPMTISGGSIELTREQSLIYSIGLHKPIHHQLNYFTPNSRVISFKNYADIAAYWYPERRRIYIERLKRQEIMLFYEMKMLEFISIAVEAGLADRIRELDDDASIALIRSMKIWPLNTAIINGGKASESLNSDNLPLYISGHATFDSIDKIDTIDDIDTINECTDKITYAYIERITIRDHRESAIAERQWRIDAIKKQLSEMRADDYWKRVWLSELDVVEKIYRESVLNMWAEEAKLIV